MNWTKVSDELLNQSLVNDRRASEFAFASSFRDKDPFTCGVIERYRTTAAVLMSLHLALEAGLKE